MKLLLLAVMLLTLDLYAGQSFAGCKEYKIIEHENSTEVVCVGDEPSIIIKPRQQIIQYVKSDNELNQEQETKGNQLCNLEYQYCESHCNANDGKCNRGCSGSRAQCALSVLSNSILAASPKCKKQCYWEYQYCESTCSPNDTRCNNECISSKAQCGMQCI